MKKLDENLVNLVAQTVKDIAEEKGWLTYPKEAEVRLILTALYIVNEAIKRVRGKHGKVVGRKSSNKTG